MDNIVKAAQLRKMGASELMLATITGSYPPPHKEMDDHEKIKHTRTKYT